MGMTDKDKDGLISEEQQRYATWLSWGANSGLAILAVSFLAYIFGLLPAHTPLDQLPNVWSLPTSEYIKQTGAPTGWQWLFRINQGDFIGLFGIAWLAGCSLLCVFAVLPIYVRQRDWAFVAICIAALLVQFVAASGMLNH